MAGSEQDIVYEILKSYPRLNHNNGIRSSWAVYSNDLEQQAVYTLRACHQSMSGHYPGLYDNLITAVPCSSELDLAYIRYVIDGPFGLFKDRIELKQDGDRYYLKLTQLDTWPANVLYNFVIATRVPLEFKVFMGRWGQLVNAGVHPGLATLISPRVATYDGDPWKWEFQNWMIRDNANHWWFESNVDFSAIIFNEMNPNAFSSNFKSNPAGARPCNTIWRTGNKKTLMGRTVQQISDMFDLTQQTEQKVPEPVLPELNFNEAVIEDNDDDGWIAFDDDGINWDDDLNDNG